MITPNRCGYKTHSDSSTSGPVLQGFFRFAAHFCAYCGHDRQNVLSFVLKHAFRRCFMAKTMLYIHGNGGSPAEAERFRPLCPGWSVAGVGYCGAYPWTAKPAIEAAFLSALSSGPAAVIANSIGAYYAMCALQGMPVEKALFISPVLDMEELIRRMMLRAGGNTPSLGRTHGDTVRRKRRTHFPCQRRALLLRAQRFAHRHARWGALVPHRRSACFPRRLGAREHIAHPCQAMRSSAPVSSI